MQAALHEYTSATRRLVLPVVPDSPYARSVQLVAQPALFGILRQPTQPAHYATYPVALTLLDAEGKAVGGPYIAAAEHRWGERMEGTTLRQAPDVILIGEIRDHETMEYALNFAETGHLCMATLHANSANQAVNS